MTIKPNAAIRTVFDHVVWRAVRWLIAGLIVALAPGAALGYTPYADAFNAKYPSAVGSKISPTMANAAPSYAIGCAVCHSAAAAVTYKQAFASAYSAVGRNSTQANMMQALANIESLDTDGDGVTNIGEINNLFYPGDKNDTPPSTVLPGAPTGVNAVAGNSQATVNFTAPGANGGSAVTLYTVTASPGGATATGAASPITVIRLSNGVDYTFTVKATTLWGTGTASLASSAITPTALATAPTGVSAVASGSAQATVSFTVPASDGGTPITGYTVTSSPGGITATGAGSSIIVTGLTNDTTYTFTVKATNSGGSGPDSAASDPVTPKVVVSPVPDQVNSIQYANAGNGMAVIYVTPPAANGSPITSYSGLCRYVSGAGVTLDFTFTFPTPLLVLGDLTNQRQYLCQFAASNAFGSSGFTNPTFAVSQFGQVLGTVAQFTPFNPGYPGVPTSITATPGNAQATIAFAPPTNDGGSPILDYTAYCLAGTESAPGTSLTATGSASPLTVTGLVNETAYACWVTARNDSGTFPALVGRALPVSVTPTALTLPSAPTGVSATAGNAQATVSFSASTSNGGSAITGYTVTSSPGGIDVTGSGSPITVTGLTNSTAYTFTVSAINSVGAAISAASSPVTPVGPLVIPGAPTGVSASITGTDLITTSWSAVTGATSYNVYMANATGVNKANSPTATGWHVHTSATSPFAAHSGTPGLPYYMVVTALNSAGESTNSAEVSATVPAPATTTTTTTTTSTTSSTTTTAVPTTTTTTATATTTTAAATTTTTGATATTTAASTTTTTTTTSTTLGAAATLNFVAGWNLVGNGSSGSLDVSALNDAANVNTVWKWIAATAKWAFYTPTLGTQALIDYAALKGYEVLSTLASGEGFWVNAVKTFGVQLPAESELPAAAFMPSGAKPLGHGWSLIAIGETKTPGEFNAALSGLSTAPANPADIPVNLTTLWAWDAAQPGWYFYAPALEKSGDLANYISLKGYLDFSTKNKTLGQGTGFWVNIP